MPKVSIIIPTYNCAKYITGAVESILAQTYKDYEVIIVDDGSTTDNTKEVLTPYTKKGLVKYIYQENSGVSAARNKGIKEAKGEYIAFLDADDIWEPEFLQTFSMYWDKYDFLMCDNYRTECDKDNNVISREIQKRPRDLQEDLLYFLLKHGGIGSPDRVMIRKDFLKKHAIAFDESLPFREDKDFYVQIAQAKPKVKIIEKPLVTYRIWNDGRVNATRRIGIKWIEYEMYFKHKHRLLYKQLDLKDIYAKDLLELARKCKYYKKYKYMFSILFEALYTWPLLPLAWINEKIRSYR